MPTPRTGSSPDPPADTPQLSSLQNNAGLLLTNSNQPVDADLLQTMLFKSSIVSDSLSSVLTSLQTAVDNLHGEVQSIHNRLDQVAHSRSFFPLCPPRPLSCQSVHSDIHHDTLADRLLRTEAECNRLRREVAYHVEHPNPYSSSADVRPPMPPLVFPTSAFQPIVSPSTNFKTPITIVSSATQTTSSFRPVPSLSPPRHFTRNLNHTLPVFKGLAHERPIKFITDFELCAFALVGTDGDALLQTVHQALSDGALLWLGHIQTSSDPITTWDEFKVRFYERYRTPEKIQIFRTELRLLFQKDQENTLDFFDRLKLLLIEIDPTGSETWIKHKFIQRLRSDIRSRFNIDPNMSLRDVVRHAQQIESNIAQQKLDDQIKHAAIRDSRHLAAPSSDLSSLPPSRLSHVAADDVRYATAAPHALTDGCLPSPSTTTPYSAIPSAPGSSSARQSSRWWCPHCQRSGHSWERCHSNPDGTNYRPPPIPLLPTSQPLPPSALPSTSPSKNPLGR